VLAQLLTVEGFTSPEQVATTAISTLAAIEGFDEELATALKERATAYIQTKNEEIISQLEHLGVEQDLIDVLDVDPEHLLKLAEYGIKTVEDLGELTVEEFKALTPGAKIAESAIRDLIEAAKTEE
jgi:N utilization substance protein A